MVEGDPNIVKWQVWEDANGSAPELPEGLAAAGPWFPFAAVGGPLLDKEDGPYLMTSVIYRRPLIRKDDDSIAATAWRGDPRG